MKWEYKEFAETISHTEEWIEFLNKKGNEGWELISYTTELNPFNDLKKYLRKCIFKRKFQPKPIGKIEKTIKMIN